MLIISITKAFTHLTSSWMIEWESLMRTTTISAAKLEASMNWKESRHDRIPLCFSAVAISWQPVPCEVAAAAIFISLSLQSISTNVNNVIGKRNTSNSHGQACEF